MFSRIAAELSKRGYQRTVVQCSKKIKALKNRYKQIVDKLRRSGTPSKKKRKRPTKLSRAEASAKSIVTDLLEGQDRAERCKDELELRWLELEERMAVEERERDQAFRSRMADMM